MERVRFVHVVRPMWVRVDHRRRKHRWTAPTGRGWRIAAATLAAGLLSGYWTVDSMRPQGLAPPPPYGSARVSAAETELVEPQWASNGLFGSVSAEDAGFRWAEMAAIRTISDCPEASATFRNGCARYLSARAERAAALVTVTRAARPPVEYAVPDDHWAPEPADVPAEEAGQVYQAEGAASQEDGWTTAI